MMTKERKARRREKWNNMAKARRREENECNGKEDNDHTVLYTIQQQW